MRKLTLRWMSRPLTVFHCISVLVILTKKSDRIDESAKKASDTKGK